MEGATVGPGLELVRTCCPLPAPARANGEDFILAGLTHCFPSRGHDQQRRALISLARNGFRDDTAKMNKCPEPEAPAAGRVGAPRAPRAPGLPGAFRGSGCLPTEQKTPPKLF